MRKLVFGTILFVFVLMSAGLIMAQANFVPYEGRLTTPTGTRLVDDTATMEFSIYDALSAGTLLWGPELHPAVRLDNGVFNIQLGSIIGSPAVFFTGSPLFLEIKVRESEVLTPRQAISSVPYAIHTLNGPGIAQDRNGSLFAITSTIDMADLAVVTITIPSDGYIFVEGRAMVRFSGTLTANYLAAQIDETPGGPAIGGRFSLVGMASPPNASLIFHEVTAQQTYFKTAGTYAFRLEAIRFIPSDGSGSRDIFYPVVTAIFLPVAYGPVTTVVSSAQVPGFKSSRALPGEDVTLSGQVTMEPSHQVDLRELELIKQTEKAKDDN